MNANNNNDSNDDGGGVGGDCIYELRRYLPNSTKELNLTFNSCSHVAKHTHKTRRKSRQCTVEQTFINRLIISCKFLIQFFFSFYTLYSQLV